MCYVQKTLTWHTKEKALPVKKNFKDQEKALKAIWREFVLKMLQKMYKGAKSIHMKGQAGSFVPIAFLL